MSEKITKTWLKKQEKAFLSDRANRVAMDAVTAAGVMESAKRPDAFRTDLHAFSVSLPQKGITNQKRSGRCWMFAALNTMRFRIVKKLNLEDFELSQAYTMFWDKLEKANYFLESILKTLDEPVNGRLLQWLLMGDYAYAVALEHVGEVYYRELRALEAVGGDVLGEHAFGGVDREYDVDAPCACFLPPVAVLRPRKGGANRRRAQSKHCAL